MGSAGASDVVAFGAVAAPPEVLVLGVLTGLGYGLAAVGLVLAFRASRVVNLAHGQVGAVAAIVLAVLVQRWEVPYWIAFVVALGVGALVGAALEVTIVRRLGRAPPLMTLVATLGAAQFLLFLTVAIGSELTSSRLFPQPAGLPRIGLGTLTLTPASLALLGLGPLAVGALALLLRRTTLGLGLRASAANPEGARLLGVDAPAMHTLAWALAGALAALTAALVLPAGAAPDVEALGPSLLLRALAAGVIAGMGNLPLALVAGVAIGVVEQIAIWNAPDGHLPELVLFGVIVAGLLVRPVVRGRRAERDDWTAQERWTALAPTVRAVPLVRWGGRILAVVALSGAALVPLVAGSADEVTLTTVMSFAMVGVSVWVVIGLSGQLSLGQFALAGVGATFAAGIADTAGSPALGLLAAPVGGAALAVAIGLPTLRLPGVMAGVATLGFALAAESWLFTRSWALGPGIEMEKLDLGPVGFDSTEGAYLLSLAALAGCVLLACNLGRGGFARRARAVRDNEPAARALGVPAPLVRLQAFAVGGAMAGLGGAVLAQAVFRINPATFGAQESIDVVAMAVLGGLAIVGGPLLGALYIVALPALVQLSSAALAATTFGWLVLILAVPGGLAALVEPLRRHGAALLLRLASHDPQLAWLEPRAPGGPAPAAGANLSQSLGSRPRDDANLSQSLGPRPRDDTRGVLPVLELHSVVRHFGGVRAVDGASLSVSAGEAVGLVGPNGAGKTSMLDIACGIERPTSGRVLLDGEDVTALPPELRAARGLARSFQDAALFPTLTVLEVVALGLERRRPTRLLAAASGWPAAERAKRARARELVALLGLAAYVDAPVHTLSTGTRRLTELACMLAFEPRVLLLDEPSAGLAQPEVRALARLLARVRAELGPALVVVEHDLPFVMGLVDRVVVIADGRVAAEGRPADIGRDQRAAVLLGSRAAGAPTAALVGETV